MRIECSQLKVQAELSRDGYLVVCDTDGDPAHFEFHTANAKRQTRAFLRVLLALVNEEVALDGE